ncbi:MULTISPECIES: BlaI/MecI/CopY family transcriptional regulator [Paenibacillus]|uniref:BlaI/MecI/CopY family transcriptional regulator n=1 Tax=Paenibacillus radicis (ex Xue et al. 2023) TaxID=2972489 RepID=A0ABT1YAE1_9BACL|nr:BlaI/MecI/CopY family transcriptional regulator [Paenibacillus radicis (ex Xue et al. 2023)]MCR8630160.1 BlaI/MecI/CopY family transcriptional regulator [Paenibacillus radicis (ex Xue et al. 2023)]
MQITKAEMEIMQVVWECGERMTTKEIAEKLPDKKITTLLTLAGRLIDKGALHSIKLGRSHAYEYWAAISEKEYQKMQTQSFVRAIHNGSAKSLISALFKDENLTKKDIDELREFINREADSHD